MIDGWGRVQQETQIFEPAILVADVPLRTTNWEPTFYVRFGDWFAQGCWAVVGVALGWAVGRSWRALRSSGETGE